MQQIRLILQNFLNRLLGQVHMPTIRWTDVVEVIVISWLIYHILLWIRGSRAWNLLRGLVFVFFIYVISVLANMTTITWIIRSAASIAILGGIILPNVTSSAPSRSPRRPSSLRCHRTRM